MKEKTKLREGVYDFMGNTVHYEDGMAYDLDSAEYIPVDALLIMGDFVRPFNGED